MTKQWMVTVVVASAMLAGIANAAEEAANATLTNLQAAYKNESNARSRYTIFASAADEEGYQSVAALFRAMARSEDMRAEKHAALIKTLGAEPTSTPATVSPKSTKENLQATIAALTAEKDTLYPPFAKQADADKNERAAMGFKGSVAIAGSNIKICQQVLGELNAWKAPGKTVLVCQVCAYVSIDPQLKNCPVCNAPREKFDVIK
jgi:rubrerythrin